MKGKFIVIATVAVLGVNSYINNKCDKIEYYDDHSIPYAEKAEKHKEDNDRLVIVVDNASPTDKLMAERVSKRENAPIFRVSSDDSIPVELVAQDRRGMFVYGNLDGFVESVLINEGFFYADNWG